MTESHEPRGPIAVIVTRLLALSLSLGCCACGTSTPIAADPFLDDPATTPAADVADAETGFAAEPSPSADRTADQPLQTADVAADAAEPLRVVEPAGHVSAITFTPAEPRLPIGGCPVPGAYACPPHDGLPTWCPPGASPYAIGSKHFPDEYLCDGGDRDDPVHFDAFNRLGLDTEDTVAEYVDENGKRVVKPTNRVCVYSPRFGAVRSVDTPGERGLVQQLAAAKHRTSGNGLRNRVATVQHDQRTAGENIRVRSRVSGIDLETRLDSLDHTGHLAGHTKLINVHESIRFLKTGILEANERPIIARGIQAAIAWSQDRSPVATAQLIASQAVEVKAEARQYIGVEDEKRTPGRLRIVKLADKSEARAGEIVTFTIRYDNVGDRALRGLRVVDNLTPRLQYVEDSATSDRAGRLVVQDNGEGSLVLIFEVDENLEGHTGGVVTFRARVN